MADPLKTLMNEHQYNFPFTCGQENDISATEKIKLFQFHVRYMPVPKLKEHI